MNRIQNRRIALLLIVYLATILTVVVKPENLPLATYRADWLVIGAGPAGIAAVTGLLDAGIKPADILWVDNTFKVGALGKYYKNIPPNSSQNSFLKFFTESPILRRYEKYFRSLATRHHNNQRTLAEIINPLQTITNKIRQSVANVQGSITKISYNKEEKIWKTSLPAIAMEAYNVILAIGAHPKQLTHDTKGTRIKLEDALDKNKLQKKIHDNDTHIVVVGSSHSAALALKNLVTLGCNNITHVYKHEFRFKQKLTDGVLYPFTGLKGIVGSWIKKNLPHQSIKQFHIDSTEAIHALRNCEYFIDAIGFEIAMLPVDQKDLYELATNPHNLGPNLYGIGIAFPNKVLDVAGNREPAVGILNAIKIVKQQLPLWLENAKATKPA